MGWNSWHLKNWFVCLLFLHQHVLFSFQKEECFLSSLSGRSIVVGASSLSFGDGMVCFWDSFLLREREERERREREKRERKEREKRERRNKGREE